MSVRAGPCAARPGSQSQEWRGDGGKEEEGEGTSFCTAARALRCLQGLCTGPVLLPNFSLCPLTAWPVLFSPGSLVIAQQMEFLGGFNLILSSPVLTLPFEPSKAVTEHNILVVFSVLGRCFPFILNLPAHDCFTDSFSLPYQTPTCSNS